MFLRRLRTSAALRRGATDGGVLAALRAELAHELSSSDPSVPPPFHCQDAPDFVTASDAPHAQDLLLRRRADSEEVLVSALLAPLVFEGQEPLPRDLLMKVFVSKPGAAPVLHFDCRAFWAEGKPGVADCAINAVRYHSSPGDDGEDKYEGPEFRFGTSTKGCIARISDSKRHQHQPGKLDSAALVSEGTLPVFKLAEDYGRDIHERSLIESSIYL